MAQPFYKPDQRIVRLQLETLAPGRGPAQIVSNREGHDRLKPAYQLTSHDEGVGLIAGRARGAGICRCQLAGRRVRTNGMAKTLGSLGSPADIRGGLLYNSVSNNPRSPGARGVWGGMCGSRVFKRF